MIEMIQKGITDAIYAEFGDEYDIYTEAVEQGLKEPCFFVLCTSPSDKVFLGKRRKVSIQYMIQYIAKGPNKRQEINNVFPRLNRALEYITVNSDLYAAFDISVENIEDGVLNVSVVYEYFTYSTDEGDVMEERLINQEVM